MENYIEKKYDYSKNREVAWISNPINNLENFADKWIDAPKKEENFKAWIKKVKEDIEIVLQQRSFRIQTSLEQPFGKGIVTETFNKYGETKRLLRENGQLNMAKKTGVLGVSGVPVKNHNFFGNGK